MSANSSVGAALIRSLRSVAHRRGRPFRTVEDSRRCHSMRVGNANRLLAVALLALPMAALAEGDAELAQDLSNPLADLVSIPIQMTFDRDIGPADDGTKVTTNVSPVVPVHLNEDWNLITRTIVPIIHQDEIFPGAGSQFGLGDINLTLFFSPKKPTAGGFIWGVGPVFVLPTGTNDLLSSKKWSAGPGVVVLTTRGSWTFGMLANHVWSFAGDDARQDISNTLIQPFAAYTWPSAISVSVQSESTYNWKAEQWSVPVNVAVSKLVRFGKLPVSLAGGVGYWAKSPDAGAEGLRFRVQATIVLPKSVFSR